MAPIWRLKSAPIKPTILIKSICFRLERFYMCLKCDPIPGKKQGPTAATNCSSRTGQICSGRWSLRARQTLSLMRTSKIFCKVFGHINVKTDWLSKKPWHIPLWQQQTTTSILKLSNRTCSKDSHKTKDKQFTSLRPAWPSNWATFVARLTSQIHKMMLDQVLPLLIIIRSKSHLRSREGLIASWLKFQLNKYVSS